MITAFERRAMPLEIDFELDITWDRSRAYTVDQINYNQLFGKDSADEEPDSNQGRSEDTTYLIVDSYCEIEEFDRLSEVAAVTRPRILVILGMICFVTSEPLTPFGFFNSIVNVANPNANVGNHQIKLLIEEDDFSAELNRLLEAMNGLPDNKKPLVFSLLDRWRKASFFDKENEESFLYEDETILACFHIIEMLAEQFSNQIDNEIEQRVKLFTADILVNSLFIQNNQTHNDLNRLLYNALSTYMTIKPKILRMMRELNMLEPRSKALIDRFLNHRNAIAHGRVNLYEDKVIYPLKPFFSHLKDIYEDIGVIRTTSARLIAAYLGISLWEDEWNELIDGEIPPYERVQQFNRNHVYEGLSCQELEDGLGDGINIWVFIHYYRIGVLKIQPFTLALSRYIMEVILSEENASLILYVAAILADSNQQNIAESSRNLLIQLKGSQHRARFDMRDVLKELTYQGKEHVWLKQFLIDCALESRPAKD